MNHIAAAAKKGFTLVELLIVVVVIIILASITANLYMDSQNQARDIQIQDAAIKFGDAIELISAKYYQGKMPAGGANSTSSVSSSKCANGGGGFQGYQYGAINTNYKCTLGDAVVDGRYLTPEFFTSLPPNPAAGNTPSTNFMTQLCSDNMYYLFFVQTAPNPDTKAKYTSTVSGVCSNQAANINNLGMGGVIKLDVLPSGS